MIKKISMRIYCLLLIIVVYLRQYGTHLAFRLESIRNELLPELKEKDDEEVSYTFEIFRRDLGNVIGDLIKLKKL